MYVIKLNRLNKLIQLPTKIQTKLILVKCCSISIDQYYHNIIEIIGSSMQWPIKYGLLFYCSNFGLNYYFRPK